MARLDLLQEQKIQRQLQDLNARERADIAKERGEPVPQQYAAPNNPPLGQNQLEQPPAESRLDSRQQPFGDGPKIRRRDPNAAYQPQTIDYAPAPPEPAKVPASQRSLHQSTSQQVLASGRPPPVASTLRPRPTVLSYTSQGNFISLMAETSGITNAHKELKTQQMKL